MRKHNLVRKVAAMTAAIAMGLSLLACGGGEKETKAPETQKEESVGETDAESTEEAAGTDGAGTETKAAGSEEGGKKDLKVAIVKQMDHASLDEIADAVAAELDKLAADNGITIEYEIYSGQGDQSTLKQIGDQAVADGVDMIIPVATLAAQVMTVCAEETKTPVIYAAISDPEAAEVTGIDYVTGTSDALNTEFILDMMFRQNPDIKKVGLLYSLSEANSQTPIAEAKAYLDAKRIPYTEATANTNDEVIAAASVLVSEKVDAVFTPTDNVIMSAELAIADSLIEAGIPHYTGADSFVRNGAFATCGVNYTGLGTKTADLAYQAVTEGMDGMEDFYKMDGGIITVNTETAEGLKIDHSVFADMGELVEVQTTEE
ncbi:MAG: ABC transporter [Lachnospiraceae bacterium]|nr:ABC transporter [Lachnospiraceae bacterium]